MWQPAGLLPPAHFVVLLLMRAVELTVAAAGVKAVVAAEAVDAVAGFAAESVLVCSLAAVAS
jgi:hypothetical protein